MITQILRVHDGVRCVEGFDEEVLQGAPWLAQLPGKCDLGTTPTRV